MFFFIGLRRSFLSLHWFPYCSSTTSRCSILDTHYSFLFIKPIFWRVVSPILFEGCITIKVPPSTSTPKCSKTLERKNGKGRWYTNNLFAFNLSSNIIDDQCNWISLLREWINIISSSKSWARLLRLGAKTYVITKAMSLSSIFIPPILKCLKFVPCKAVGFLKQSR